jgi:hypothetical protein
MLIFDGEGVEHLDVHRARGNGSQRERCKQHEKKRVPPDLLISCSKTSYLLLRIKTRARGLEPDQNCRFIPTWIRLAICDEVGCL